MKLDIPNQPISVIQRLESMGHTAYLAGGCVRDMLLGVIPNDYDVATSAHPQEVMGAFACCKVIPTGLKHGTVTVQYEGCNIEITTFRCDGLYTDHRHPSGVMFSHSAKEDSKRRDFTVNAMYCTSDGEILDFHNGKGDLQNGIIRCVGNAKQRFQEDALRILRALRFAARLGFEIDEETACAMKDCAHLLKHIAAERVLAELNGFFSCSKSAELCSEYISVFKALFGVSKCSVEELRALAYIRNEFRLAVFIALYGGADGAHSLMKALKADKGKETQLCAATDALYTNALSNEESIAMTVNKYGVQLYECMLEAAILMSRTVCDKAHDIMIGLKDGTIPETVQKLSVNGTELKDKCGLEGAKLGAAMKTLFIKVYCGLPNEKEALLHAAKEYIIDNERE